MSSPENPYIVTEAGIRPPPTDFLSRMRYLGPGLILTASIVGSGELIMTTLLGAKAGFVCFWVIILSCLVKVAVQVEFGKNAIYSGQSTMAALNGLPGPRLGKANWSIWLWLALMLPKMLQVGGIVGAVAMLINVIHPAFSIQTMVWPVAISAALIVMGGGYKLIERVCLTLIALFTLFSMASLISVQFTPYAITWAEFSSGLSFQLPAGVTAIALGAFGITGIGGDEIMAYNYWLIEKGYAAYSGPKHDTEEWRRRAKGWIRVMQLDALVSMAVYTLVTVIFYLLGAAILHGSSSLPDKEDQLISSLSLMYTESLGPWASDVFLAGAFVVLYSTVLAALGAWTRMFSDAFAQIGLLDFRNSKQRHRFIAVLAFVIPLMWAAVYLYYKNPAYMVVVGGLVTVVILFIVAFAAAWFRYKELPSYLKPGRAYDAWLWLSILAICAVGVFALWSALPKAA
ncbi:MAG: Nramp family divalent metal transporter [Verrucomicrobiales bacterium]|nr:Nramp family divalent metal transporter [Verrucomicrobiales bacterium]MCP5557330.1 Nramp family divalent metal transporter [Verrucomicrobiaceae bacterium]